MASGLPVFFTPCWSKHQAIGPRWVRGSGAPVPITLTRPGSVTGASPSHGSKRRPSKAVFPLNRELTLIVDEVQA